MKMSTYDAFLLRGETLPASCALVLPEFKSSGDWTGVWTHEYFHFLQFTGTGAGRLIAWMFAQLGHSVSAFLREPPDALKAAEIWRFPIRQWCADEADEDLRSILRKHFSFLFFTNDTLELLLGWLPTHVADNRWRDPSYWPWSTKPPQTIILPQLSAGYGLEPFGAFHIMETAAAIEGLRWEYTDIQFPDGKLGFSLPQRAYEVLKRMPPYYSLGVRYIEQHTQIPKLMVASVAVLAADVALNAHVETFVEAGPDVIAWEDWHPGWRFVKAVSAIESLVIERNKWPRNEEELAAFCEQIRSICKWPDEPDQFMPHHVFQESPSRSDRLRQTIAEEARVLRHRYPSLWSIGPRQNIIDVSFYTMKPPLLIHYGCETIRAIRPDVDLETAVELWRDTQMNHIGWQLLGHGSGIREAQLIECFPWSMEGENHGCPSSNGSCRWFPAPDSASLPESCPMLRTIRQVCGDYWNRLRPLYDTR